MDGGNEIWNGPKLVTDGDWAGWRTWAGMDAFEDQTGPFYFKEENGVIRSAFRAEARHMNGGGFMHGGCMMTFADFALFAIAWQELKDVRAVTVSLNGEFISAGAVGDMVEATGEIVKAGGSLVFIRGTLRVADQPLMTFSGVIKKIKPR
jgi:uncharacterized protein (TIGR00369 family)